MNFQQNQETNQQIQDTLNAIRTNEVLELEPLQPTIFNTLYTVMMDRNTSPSTNSYSIDWTR